MLNLPPSPALAPANVRSPKARRAVLAGVVLTCVSLVTLTLSATSAQADDFTGVHLVPGHNSGVCVALNAASGTDGSLQLANCSDTEATQLWNYNEADQTLSTTVAGARWCLTNNSVATGAVAASTDCTSAARISTDATGHFVFPGGKVLDAYNYAGAGGVVGQWDNNGRPNQQWSARPVANQGAANPGATTPQAPVSPQVPEAPQEPQPSQATPGRGIQLVTKYDADLCVTATTDQAKPVTVSSCGDSASQKWTHDDVTGRWATTLNGAPVCLVKPALGNVVGLAPCTSDAADTSQMWGDVSDLDDSAGRIGVPDGSGVLDVAGRGGEGTALVFWPWGGGDNQRFVKTYPVDNSPHTASWPTPTYQDQTEARSQIAVRATDGSSQCVTAPQRSSDPLTLAACATRSVPTNQLFEYEPADSTWRTVVNGQTRCVTKYEPDYDRDGTTIFGWHTEWVATLRAFDCAVAAQYGRWTNITAFNAIASGPEAANDPTLQFVQTWRADGTGAGSVIRARLMGVVDWFAAPEDKFWRVVPTGGGSTGPNETELTVVNGDLTVTTDDATIANKDVHGRILIRANNVKIVNSVIRGADRATTQGSLVDVGPGTTGTQIVDTQFVAADRSLLNGSAIRGYNFTATRVNISGTIDGIRILGGNVKVIDSWIHDLPSVADVAQPDGTSHNDSIQVQAGVGITVQGSKFEGASNAALMIGQDLGAIGTVQISDSQLGGGGCTINIAEKGRGPLVGVLVDHNTFKKDSRVPNCAIISPITTVVVNTNNLFTDGSAVTVRRGGA